MSLLKNFKNVIEGIIADVIYDQIAEYFGVRLRSFPPTPNYSNSNVFENDFNNRRSFHKHERFVKEYFQDLIDKVIGDWSAKARQLIFLHENFGTLVYSFDSPASNLKGAIINVLFNNDSYRSHNIIENLFTEIGEAHAEATFRRVFQPIFAEVFEQMKNQKNQNQ